MIPSLDPKRLADSLFEACPHCCTVAPLFDAFLEALRSCPQAYVSGTGTTGPRDVPLETETLRLNCQTCRGTHRVLTELGRQVAALLPGRDRGHGDDEIPF